MTSSIHTVKAQDRFDVKEADPVDIVGGALSK